MRDYATSWLIKFILGAIVIVFVFWGVGSFRSEKANRVASVNGETITLEEYREAFNNLIEQMRQQFGNNLNDDLIKTLNLEQQALDRLINRKLLLQRAQELNLHVSDEELAEAITAVEAFKAAGVFNNRQYQRVLSNYRLTPETFEQMQKQSMLIEKLSTLISSGVKVSNAEALDWFNWQNATVDLDFVLIDPTRYTEVAPDDDAMEAYFEENKESYKTEPQRKARYLFFDPKIYEPQVELTGEDIEDYYTANVNEFKRPPTVEARHILIKVNQDATPEQVDLARQKAADIHAQAVAGEDFTELAKAYSEGPTKDKGGYLGTFERDRMVKPFADKAFAMSAGEISEPVRTRFGWHVIKVEQVNPASTATRQEAEPQIRIKLTERKAKTVAYDIAENLLDRFYDTEDLLELAEEPDVKVATTSFFTRTQGPVQGISDRAQFAKVAFELAEKDVSDIQEFADGYYIIQVIESLPASVPDLAAVRAKVQKDLVKVQQEEMAKQTADELLAAVKGGGTLEEAVAKQGLSVATTGPFKRNDAIPQIGYEREIATQAFLLSTPGDAGQDVYKGKNGFYLMRLREKTVPDKAGFEKEKASIEQNLLQQKRGRTFNEWLEQLKAQSEIIITKKFSE